MEYPKPKKHPISLEYTIPREYTTRGEIAYISNGSNTTNMAFTTDININEPPQIRPEVQQIRRDINEEIQRNAEIIRRGIVRPVAANNINNRAAGTGQIVDTIGMEFESLGLNLATVQNIVQSIRPQIGHLMSITRDASSEIMVNNVEVSQRKVISISSHTPEGREVLGKIRRQRNNSKSGYEIVTVPVEKDVAELILSTVLPNLENSGDFYNKRCAFHVHVGMGKNLGILKNSLHLGLYVDDLLFRLAGMGKEFRGNKNNAIYCRPLEEGPYIKGNSAHYQILNIQKALEAESFNEFWYAYGVESDAGAVNKYHPARYFAINLYSILLHGTLEFRHFNQTFDPKLSFAVTSLCQILGEMVFKGKTKVLETLKRGDVFTNNPPSYYISKLFSLLDLAKEIGCQFELQNNDIKVLCRTIENAPGIFLSKEPVLTHLRDVGINGQMIMNGNLKSTTKKPGHAGNIDIHNIEDASIIE